MPLPAPSPTSAALVTGASSGIGDRFARELAARGHNLILVARRADRLEALATELHEAHGVTAQALPADLADADARDALAAAAAGTGLAVEILVNCAGFGLYHAFLDNPRERELEVVRLDVEAVFDLTHRYAPAMVERGRGAVINLSSTSGLQPSPFNATYAASKSAVLFFSEALHEELRGTGVTVTAVLPGPVPTEFQAANEAKFAERLPKFAWVTPERVVTDSLAAAERGRRSVIPGGPLVKASFGSTRFAPKRVVLAVARRLLAPQSD